MSAADDAKDAVGDFVDAFSDSNESSKSFLENQLGALAQAAIAVGEKFGDLAFASDPLFSGVTDPVQIALLKDNLAEFGQGMVSETIIEDTGNKLNKIFEQAKAATWSLFQMGPDFFYTLVSQSSRRLRKLLATALSDAASLAARAASYNTLQQSLDRTDLNTLDASKMAQVKVNTQAALVQMDVALVQSKRHGVVQPATSQACVTALEALCTAFTNPGVIVSYLLLQDVLVKLTQLDLDVRQVVTAKGQFTASFVNTFAADVADPISRTFGTVRDQLAGNLERLTALSGKGFDKFAAIAQSVELCQKAHVFIQGLIKNPASAKLEILSSGHYGTFQPVTVAVDAQTDGPATAYLASSKAFRQAAQSVLVANILPQLATKTADLLSKITSLSAWLAAQEALLVALPALNDALAQVASSILSVAALDRTESLVDNADMKAFANATANTASRAGKAADAIALAMEDLPITQESKKGALSEVRSALLAIESSQVIATESILEETPGAIGDVDSLTEQVQQIQEQTEVLLS